MRINIKTKFRIKDNDEKALYIIAYALNIIPARMIKPTLEFFTDKYGYKITPKGE